MPHLLVHLCRGLVEEHLVYIFVGANLKFKEILPVIMVDVFLSQPMSFIISLRWVFTRRMSMIVEANKSKIFSTKARS
jgi:hypothetical protein